MISPQAERILRLRAQGMTHLEAAHELGLSEATVRNYTDRAFRALDVHSATEAYVALGWLTVPEDDMYDPETQTYYGYIKPARFARLRVWIARWFR